MDFNPLDAALDGLPSDTPFRIANAARVPSTYLLSQFLPEVQSPDYDVNAANMIIKSTMAEHVGMDAPYREGGNIVGSAFKENIVKVANVVRLSEAAQRKLQRFVQLRIANGGRGGKMAALELVRNTFLNFNQKLIVQPHLDTAEFLRGRALMAGKIDWTVDGRRLFVDYGFKADHILSDLTGTNGFGGSTTKFWETLQAARKLLKYNDFVTLMHPDTAEVAMNNSYNNIEVTEITRINRYVQSYKFRQLIGPNKIPSTDARLYGTILTYNMEVEVIDESNPRQTVKVNMINPGEFAMLGNGVDNMMVVGEGSTPDPGLTTDTSQVGYTHVGPTVEGDGEPGRWADAYRPQRERWTYEGVGVSNLLPVIPEDNRVVIRKTVMP